MSDQLYEANDPVKVISLIFIFGSSFKSSKYSRAIRSAASAISGFNWWFFVQISSDREGFGTLKDLNRH